MRVQHRLRCAESCKNLTRFVTICIEYGTVSDSMVYCVMHFFKLCVYEIKYKNVFMEIIYMFKKKYKETRE